MSAKLNFLHIENHLRIKEQTEKRENTASLYTRKTIKYDRIQKEGESRGKERKKEIREKKINGLDCTTREALHVKQFVAVFIFIT
jgi:hypothetical protein